MAAESNTTVTWKALVICPHAEMGKRLAASLLEILPQPPVVLSEYPRSGSLTGLAAKDGVNICFLDVATNAEHAQALISELAPEAPVVGLMLRKDADLILRCLRRGACEFLSEMGPDSLRAVLARLAKTQAPAPHGPAGKIWCVVPGKPGCGASTLAVHLAVQAREAGGPVLLVDTDPLSASAAFLLKLKPEFHLGDMLRDSKRLDRELWSRLTVSSNGIDVLAAPEDPAVRIDVGRQAADLCAFWSARYQTVVVDVADVRFAVESAFALRADTILLVTTNELAALQTSRRSLTYLDRAGADRSRVRLILNRYSHAAGLNREEVRKALAVAPFAAVCNDYETVQTALLEGKPSPSKSRFASDVRDLCRQLQGKPAASGNSSGAKKSNAWMRLFLSHKQALSKKT